MGLDIWFKDDIANILRPANEANLSALAASEDVAAIGGTAEPAVELRGAYRQGFVAALVTLALALGLPAPGAEMEFTTEASKARGDRSDRTLALPMSLAGGKRWGR